MGGNVLLCILLACVGSAQNGNQANTPDAIGSVVRTARLKEAAGEYAAARNILEQALAESPESPDLLRTLGSLQQDMGEYLQAERSYVHAMSLSPRMAGGLWRIGVLNDLATLYLDTKQYSKCNRLRALLEEVPSSELESNPEYAGAVLNTLATMHHAQGEDLEAERMYTQSLESWKRVGKPAVMRVAEVKNNLGKLYFDTGRFEPAAKLFEQALNEIQDRLGPDHPLLIWPLCGLAEAEFRAGAPHRAEPLFRRSVEIARTRLGSDHPHTALVMLRHAVALRQLGRKHEARTLEKHAKAVLRKNAEWNLAGNTVDVRSLSAEAKR